MSQATVTDIHLVPFETRFVGPRHSQGMNLWLMTSPEYHMETPAGCRLWAGIPAVPPQLP